MTVYNFTLLFLLSEIPARRGKGLIEYLLTVARVCGGIAVSMGNSGRLVRLRT